MVESISMRQANLVGIPQDSVQVSTPNFRANEYNTLERTPESDYVDFSSSEKKSSKGWIYAIGTAAVLATAYILGRRGTFGESVKKFLGGAKDAAKDVANESQEKAKKAAEEAEAKIKEEAKAWLEADKKAAEEAEKKLAESNAKNEQWLKEQHDIKEKEYSDWFNKALDEKAIKDPEALKEKFKSEIVELEELTSNKTVKELWEMNSANSREKRELMKLAEERCKAKTGNTYRVTYKELAEKYLTEDERMLYNHLDAKNNLIKEHINKKKDAIVDKLAKESDKQVETKNLIHYATEEEQHAFGVYYDAYPLNQELRESGFESLSAGAKAKVELMDGVFAKAPELGEEAVVYRAVHGHPIFESQNKFCDSIKEGVIFEDPSWMSTSTNVNNAQFRQFADHVIDEDFGCLMRIKVDKKTKGVFGGFYEYLLPRGSKIKVNKIEQVGNIKIVDCENIL